MKNLNEKGFFLFSGANFLIRRGAKLGQSILRFTN